MQVTETLARFIVESRDEDIPHAMRHEAKRALVNILGCAIGSGRHETVERTVSALQPFFGPPQATLAGRSERCDILNAAQINGIAAHVMDFDDTHPHAIHPSASVNPLVMELTAKREPRSGLEGKFSIYHACAVALARGRAGETEFANAAVLDPEIVALRRKVEAFPDPAVAMMEAYVTIRLIGGRRHEKHVPSALGSVERPMSDHDLEAKFLALFENVFPTERADQLIAACWSAEQFEDASSLSRLRGAIQPI